MQRVVGSLVSNIKLKGWALGGGYLDLNQHPLGETSTKVKL
jgi:hypothetical protein